jgi:hypothetical protein
LPGTKRLTSFGRVKVDSQSIVVGSMTLLDKGRKRES